MSEKQAQNRIRTSRDAARCQHRESTFKLEQIALCLAVSLLASQQDLGVMADVLSILVNLCHLRQIVTSWRGHDA